MKIAALFMYWLLVQYFQYWHIVYFTTCILLATLICDSKFLEIYVVK